jgi:hypothetical protein
MAKKEMTKKGVKIRAVNIEDLPKNVNLSDEDLKKMWGGVEAFNKLIGDKQSATSKQKQAIMIGYKGSF